jgi:hypothetical protein
LTYNRIRRVKCDEGLIHCNRCLSTGRHCDGYASPTQSTLLKTTSSIPVSVLSPSRLVSQGQFASREEGESFDFFVKYAIKDICGCFNSPFWQRELLQATHYHPAIRHGVIAVGTMHRRYTSSNDDTVANHSLDKQLHFALEHSNKAIQELMREAKSMSTKETHLKTIMTCCILFSTLACLQDEQKEALVHIRCGLGLMKELIRTVLSMPDPSKTLATHPVTMKSLQQIFLSLNVQALSFMDSADVVHWETVPVHFMENCPSLSTDWNKLECAQHYFESLLSNVLAFIKGLMELPIVDNIEASVDAVSEGTLTYLQQRFHTGVAQLHKTFPEVFSETADADAVSIRLMCAQVELFLMMYVSTERAENRCHFDDGKPLQALMDLVIRLESSRVKYRDSVCFSL